MNARDLQKATKLAGMASGLNGITYQVEKDAQPMRDSGRVWYPMIATRSDGKTWPYWISARYGSWEGMFPAGSLG